jgi:hypothetical protein
MDEQPTQLLKETRISLPMQPGCVAKYDYEHERNGMRSTSCSLHRWRIVGV